MLYLGRQTEDDGFDSTVLPGEMHCVLTSHTEVKVGCMFHFIRMSCFFYPVTNRVAVHPIHDVPGVITTTSVMAGPTTW